MWRLAATLLILAALPHAEASGRAEVGPVVIVLDNDHERDCIETVSGLCPAELRPGSPGETEADVGQNIDLLAVGLREESRRSVNDAVGFALLPAGEFVSYDASTFVVPNPVFPLFAENVGEAQAPGGLVVLFVNEQNWGWGYYGPGLDPPDPEPRHRRAVIRYYDEGLTYEGYRGLHDHEETSTDSQVRNTLTYPCSHVEGEPSCEDQQDALADSIAAQTPNLMWGSGINTTRIAGSDDALGPRDAIPPGPRPDGVMSPRISVPGPHVEPAGEGRERAIAPRSWTPDPPREKEPGPARPPSPPTPAPPAGERPAPARAAFVEPAALAATLALSLLLAALYSRIRRADVLLSSRRAAIHALLAARGRLPIAAIARELGVDWSTARHHVRVLQRSGSVVLEPRDGLLLVGLPGARGAPEAEAPAWRRLLAIVETAGGEMRRDALHNAAGDIPLRTRNHAMRRLIARGDLVARGDVLRRAPAGGAGA